MILTLKTTLRQEKLYGDDSDIEDNFEAREGDSKDSENEAEKEKEEEGAEKRGRMPRLLVIEDLEQEGSADDPELEDILVIEDFVEKSSGDDRELDVVLEDSIEEETEDESFKETLQRKSYHQKLN